MAVCVLLMAVAATPAAAAVSGSGVAAGQPQAGQTRPMVTSLRASEPKLTVSDGSDLAALRSGEPAARPLNMQLQLLFEAFLSDAAPGAAEAVQLEVHYTYAPEAVPGAHVPVLLQPLTPFVVPDDWQADSAFISRLAARIRQWFELYHPSDQGAQLSFDLTAMSQDATQPLKRAHDVTLPVADITDLDGATPPAPAQPVLRDSGVTLRQADTTTGSADATSPAPAQLVVRDSGVTLRQADTTSGAVGSGCCTNELGPDTWVTMGDGSSKAIRAIRVGDLVASADGAVEPVRIAASALSLSGTLVTIRLLDGPELSVTPSFVFPDGIQADEVASGDLLQTADGPQPVMSVTSSRFTGTVTALTVGGGTGWFANDVLVSGLQP